MDGGKLTMQYEIPEFETTLDKIRPGQYQTRRVYDVEKMAGLIQTIGEKGLINPPIVFGVDGYYYLLAGERRSRGLCALALMAAGWGQKEAVSLVCRDDTWELLAGYASVLSQVTVRVRVAPGTLDLEEISLIENIQREDLRPSEEGRALKALLKKYKNLTRLSRAVGRSTGYIEARMGLLDLDAEIRDYIDRKQLSKDTRVTKALLSLPEDIRLPYARRFVERGSTIKQVESACRKVLKLLEATQMSQKSAATVPIAQARVISPVAETVVERRVCLCEQCATIINELAEELCNGCSGGLTEKCLTCPGVVEFIDGLVRAARRDDDNAR
jgi:ParB-like chromosome segregation protein Spo0J